MNYNINNNLKTIKIVNHLIANNIYIKKSSRNPLDLYTINNNGIASKIYTIETNKEYKLKYSFKKDDKYLCLNDRS